MSTFVGGRMLKQALYVLALSSMFATIGSSQSFPSAKTGLLATINGVAIMEDQVKEAAQSDIEKLELEKAKADLAFERDKHSIYERTLEVLIEKRVIELESDKRGVPPQLLVKTEVDDKVLPPSADEINRFWLTNKARINVPQEEAFRQI